MTTKNVKDAPRRWYELTRRFTQDFDVLVERESYVLLYDHGAVEGWRTPREGEETLGVSSHYGGVELHSAHPMWDGQEPTPGHCKYVTGGVCYHDGSSMAFDTIEHLFENPSRMYQRLAGWEPQIQKGSVVAMLNMLLEGADES